MTPRLLILAPAFAAAALLPAQPAPPKRIQQVLDRPEFVHATWGMEFYDLESKKTVWAVNRERLFVPGSTTKLVTIGTAFAALGADYRFHTRVYRTGPVRDGVVQGDLVLVASGDPDLTRWEHPAGSAYAFVDQDHSYGGAPLPAEPLEALRELAQQVASRGIHALTGQVIVDASLFREGTRELGTRVVISPLNINDNVIDIVVTPGARSGDAAVVAMSPRTSYLTVQANVFTVDSGATAGLRSVEDSTDLDHRMLVITGTVPRGAALNARWTVPVPSRFGEIALAEALTAAGVRAIPRLGARRMAAEPTRALADSMLVAEHVSLPFSAAARVILKVSQNLHASSMPMVLGAQPAARAAGKSGFDVAREWLQGAGLNLDGAVQGDGAGGDAYFSPAFMTRYLELVSTQPWAEAFHDALPILGTDGTLATIQTNAPAAGKVHAKTGTFSSYDPLNKRPIVHGKGLAGYFTSKSGRRIAFAIYVNNFATNEPDPTTLAGQALGEIASLAWEIIK